MTDTLQRVTAALGATLAKEYIWYWEYHAYRLKDGKVQMRFADFWGTYEWTTLWKGSSMTPNRVKYITQCVLEKRRDSMVESALNLPPTFCAAATEALPATQELYHE